MYTEWFQDASKELTVTPQKINWPILSLSAFALGVLAVVSLPLPAQQRPPSPVRFTEAREHALRRTIQLPGSVESRTVSTVASTVPGLVVDFPAREGDTVKKGQPLAQLRRQTLEIGLRAARAQLQEAESRQKLAERNLERARDLFDSKVFSQQQLDSTFFEFNAWQGRVDQLTAELDRIRDELDRCTIRAPFDGVVVREHTELGEWVKVGDPVVELLALNQLEILIDVPERYFRSLKRGGRATVTFESLPGLAVRGRINALIPRADPQARTFPVKVRIPNRGRRIGVGMLAQVSFPAGEPYRATVVPKDAVITRGPQKFVYLMNGDNTVSLLSVQTGSGVGSWIEIRDSVRAGQKVITRGNERL